MTKEEKELLLKDLCARLPYGVIVKYWSREGDGDVKIGCGNIGYVLQLGNGWWKDCKPYLRPMSSMTEEEKLEYLAVTKLQYNDNKEPYRELTIEAIDWLNTHHFDYRGLIEKGLALEAPDGMYN